MIKTLALIISETRKSKKGGYYSAVRYSFDYIGDEMDRCTCAPSADDRLVSCVISYVPVCRDETIDDFNAIRSSKFRMINVSGSSSPWFIRRDTLNKFNKGGYKTLWIYNRIDAK